MPTWTDVISEHDEAFATILTGVGAMAVGAITYILQARREEEYENARWEKEHEAQRERHAQQEHEARDEASLRLQRWKLEFIERQLGELYSPLLRRLNTGHLANRSAMRALAQKRLVPYGDIFSDEARKELRTDWKWFKFPTFNETAKEWQGSYEAQECAIVREWRHWVRTVMQPNNEAIMELLLRGAHLVVQSKAEEGRKLFDQMVDHIVSYRPVIEAWNEEERNLEPGEPLTHLYAYQNTATVPFPRELVSYVNRCHENLVKDRDEILTLTSLIKPQRSSFAETLRTRRQAGSRTESQSTAKSMH